MRCSCLSHKEFGTCDTICINTNVFLIPVRDIVRFDNDAIVGKASENGRDVGSRVQRYTSYRVRGSKRTQVTLIKIQYHPVRHHRSSHFVRHME